MKRRCLRCFHINESKDEICSVCGKPLESNSQCEQLGILEYVKECRRLYSKILKLKDEDLPEIYIENRYKQKRSKNIPKIIKFIFEPFEEYDDSKNLKVAVVISAIFSVVDIAGVGLLYLGLYRRFIKRLLWGLLFLWIDVHVNFYIYTILNWAFICYCLYDTYKCAKNMQQNKPIVVSIPLNCRDFINYVGGTFLFIVLTLAYITIHVMYPLPYIFFY
ncbi:MAG: hypothetical protein SOZ23_05195 [Methanosphaera sp.]|uniref:hypothetical protein n=1 Tax=Methanosphaera sp. TaxID=2666342 RepID=UPI0025E98FB0|nr:hypothetical protein [Methanosphaera sp.]MCI5867550.1 hypothetical protein [Methanosphaera sp.]MDD6534017.1 hypothetical protein [Methanosphaera sp.]MDY3956173.1 hypothetical protein [Methanosphaera sp.]